MNFRKYSQFQIYPIWFFVLFPLFLIVSACSDNNSNTSAEPALREDPLSISRDRIVATARAMRKLDGLNVEGAASIRSTGQREKTREEVFKLAQSYAGKYSKSLAETVHFPAAKVDAVITEVLSPEETKTLFPVIHQHLRLMRAGDILNNAEIAQDFQLIRYELYSRP